MAINLDKAPTSGGSSNQTKTIVITAVAVIVVALAAGNYLKNKKSDAPSDRDNDGIVDQVDRCPDDKGTPDYFGCPAVETASETPNAPSPSADTQPNNTVQSGSDANSYSSDKSQSQSATVAEQSTNKKVDIRPAVSNEPAGKAQTAESVAPAPVEIKNVSARLKTNSGQNTISWNGELSKAKDLQLSITTASGLNFKKDVTGMSSYTFNPGSGEWQGKKCTVTLSSADPKITIDNAKLPNTFFNCSAE
jgi:hypothetical protein